jgi:hypothetical protein
MSPGAEPSSKALRPLLAFWPYCLLASIAFLIFTEKLTHTDALHRLSDEDFFELYQGWMHRTASVRYTMDADEYSEVDVAAFRDFLASMHGPDYVENYTRARRRSMQHRLTILRKGKKAQRLTKTLQTITDEAVTDTIQLGHANESAEVDAAPLTSSYKDEVDLRGWNGTVPETRSLSPEVAYEVQWAPTTRPLRGRLQNNSNLTTLSADSSQHRLANNDAETREVLDAEVGGREGEGEDSFGESKPPSLPEIPLELRLQRGSSRSAPMRRSHIPDGVGHLDLPSLLRAEREERTDTHFQAERVAASARQRIGTTLRGCRVSPAPWRGKEQSPRQTRVLFKHPEKLYSEHMDHQHWGDAQGPLRAISFRDETRAMTTDGEGERGDVGGNVSERSLEPQRPIGTTNALL